MKSVVKVVALVVLVLVVLVGAAIVLVPMLIDPNDHKDRIAKAVEESTGRELRIEGDIGLTVFPWLGLSLGVVELGNAPGFSEPYFARTEKVGIRLKLIPLLSRKVEMDTVTIHGLQLNLAKKADGTTNWDDLTKPGAPEAKTDDGKSGESGAGLAGLAIGGLDLKNGAVSWRDGQSGQSYRIENLAAETGALALGEPVSFDIGFDLSGGKPAVAGRVEAESTLIADTGAQTYELPDLELRVDLEGEQLPAGKLKGSLGARVKADLDKQTASVEGLKLDLGELVLTGNLNADKILGDLAYRGQLEVAEFNPKDLMASMSLPAVETADAKALTSVSMSFAANGTAKQVALDPITIKLDDTTLAGQARVVDLARSAVRFDLGVDAIDVDRYLPPAAEKDQAADKPAPTPAAAAAGGAAELPAEMLRGLDLAGTAKVGKLKVAKLTLTDIGLTVNARGGLVQLKPIKANLYQGEYAGAIVVDARGSVPSISVDEKLSGLQAGPLLTDLQGKDVLTGTGDVTVKLTASGRDPEAMKQRLDGRIRFDFTDGAVKGFDVNRMLREAKAKLSGKTLPPGAGEAKTDFSALGGTVIVTDGVARNDDLEAKSPFLRINGKGSADIPKETIDYRLTTSVVATAKGQGGEQLADLAGIDIPIKVGGTFSKPTYGLDFEALVQAVAKSKASELLSGKTDALKGEGLDKLKEKLADPKKLIGPGSGEKGGPGKEVGEKIGGALKGLLGK